MVLPVLKCTRILLVLIGFRAFFLRIGLFRNIINKDIIMKDSMGVEKSFADWTVRDWPGNPDKSVVGDCVVKTFKHGTIKANVWVYYSVYFNCYHYTCSVSPN